MSSYNLSSKFLIVQYHTIAASQITKILSKLSFFFSFQQSWAVLLLLQEAALIFHQFTGCQTHAQVPHQKLRRHWHVSYMCKRLFNKLWFLETLFTLFRSLVEEMRKVSLALWEEESGVYSPDSLFSIVWRLVPRFRFAKISDITLKADTRLVIMCMYVRV